MRAPAMPKRTMYRCRRWVLAGLLVWTLAAAATAAAGAGNVLVLYSNNRLVPGNVAVDRGLREGLAAGGPVQVFSEFLDRPEFGGVSYENAVTTYLHDKYALRPPQVIVAVNDDALDFLLRHRGELFPGVPLVHAVASRSFLQALPARPEAVYGVPMEYDFAGTIEQGLRWHAPALQLVIVTGASERDRLWEARLRREAPAAAGAVPVEFIAGAPLPLLQQRLASLGERAVIFTPGFYEDGAGRLFNPRDAAAWVAANASAPVYGPFDTFIGTGVVGGRMPGFEDMGRQAATIVTPLLAGTTPDVASLPPLAPTALRLDWRALQRWGIDEQRVPADAQVFFREPGFWQSYGHWVIAALAVIVLQSGLIARLLLEQRRRRVAERVVLGQRTELAHASRLAVAGELTASIAHEINQPLGAILASADAAELLLQSGADRREDLLRIVTRIRRDDLRASDVIQRLRSLLAKHAPERKRLDLNAALADVATLLAGQARQRQVVLDIRPARESVFIDGDAVQIQQVLINLLLNAMDAVAGRPEARRVVSLALEVQAGRAVITVRDSGPGIAAEHLPRIFDSFFSTKHKGMGLGLSIARTIVEAHGGHIRAENGPGEGALVHVELPTCEHAQARAPVPA